MNKKKKYYNNLQKFRVYNSLTQAELAELLKVSIQTVRMTEQHKTHPNGHNIKSILDFFDVSFNQMFIEKDN